MIYMYHEAQCATNNGSSQWLHVCDVAAYRRCLMITTKVLLNYDEFCMLNNCSHNSLVNTHA